VSARTTVSAAKAATARVRFSRPRRPTSDPRTSGPPAWSAASRGARAGDTARAAGVPAPRAANERGDHSGRDNAPNTQFARKLPKVTDDLFGVSMKRPAPLPDSPAINAIGRAAQRRRPSTRRIFSVRSIFTLYE